MLIERVPLFYKKTKQTMSNKKFDLEERLVKFAGDTLIFLNEIPSDKAGTKS